MTESKTGQKQTPEKSESGNFASELTDLGTRMDQVFEVVRAKNHDGATMGNPMADGRMEDGSTAIIARNSQFAPLNPSWTANVVYRESKINDRGVQRTEESPKFSWDWSDPGNRDHQKVTEKRESDFQIRPGFEQEDINYIELLISAVERDNA